MKIIYFLIVIFLFFNSCSNDAPTTDVAKKPIEKVNEKKLPTFDIETHTDENGTPLSNVSVLVGGKKLKITKVNACELISKTEYKNYDIPAAAIAACGGWWAGGGDYFYILDNGNDNYTVMQGSMDEGQSSDSYNYKMVMNLSNRLGPVR